MSWMNGVNDRTNEMNVQPQTLDRQLFKGSAVVVVVVVGAGRSLLQLQDEQTREYGGATSRE